MKNEYNITLNANDMFILKELLLNILTMEKYQELINDKDYGEMRKETYKNILNEIRKQIVF